jgi:hypothetical protein
MDGGPTPFLIGQAMDGVPMDMPAIDFNGDQNGLMSMDPAWMADINDMDWVSHISGLTSLTCRFLN